MESVIITPAVFALFRLKLGEEWEVVREETINAWKRPGCQEDILGLDTWSGRRYDDLLASPRHARDSAVTLDAILLTLVRHEKCETQSGLLACGFRRVAKYPHPS